MQSFIVIGFEGFGLCGGGVNPIGMRCRR